MPTTKSSIEYTEDEDSREVSYKHVERQQFIMHSLKSHASLTEFYPLDTDIRDLSALRVPATEKMRLFSLLYQVDHAPLLPSDATGQMGGLHSGNKVGMITQRIACGRGACMYKCTCEAVKRIREGEREIE